MTTRPETMDALYHKLGPQEPMWKAGSFILALDRLGELARARGLTPKEAGAALRWHMEAMERDGEDDDDAP